MEIIENKKGSKKLCFEGYSYNKKRTTKSTVNWCCSVKAGQQCKGALTTDLMMTTVRSSIEHSHPSDVVKIEATKAIADIKPIVYKII